MRSTSSIYKYVYIHISKANDEWYYIMWKNPEVMIPNRDANYNIPTPTLYYKCDQWDGLMACLDREFGVKINESKLLESLNEDGYEKVNINSASESGFKRSEFKNGEISKLEALGFAIDDTGFYTRKYKNKKWSWYDMRNIHSTKYYLVIKFSDEWFYAFEFDNHARESSII